MFRTKLLTISTRIDGGRVTPKMRTRTCAATLLIAAAMGWSTPVLAHVKWFAPFIVGAAPQPVSATLTNVWFWTGIALALVFFVVTRLVERSSLGEAILLGMDRLSDPLWRR